MAIKSLHPEIVVLDVSMPGISGLQAARLIGKLDLSTRVLIFTMHESPRLESEVREAGAHGYVSKSQATRDLVHAIQTLLSGGTFFGSASEPSNGSSENPGRGLTFFSILTGPIVYGLDWHNPRALPVFVLFSSVAPGHSFWFAFAVLSTGPTATYRANLLNYPCPCPR